MTEATEQYLIARAQGGDWPAFRRLMEAQQERVYRLAYYLTQSHDGAEQTTQDVFIKAFRGIRHFNGQSRLFTWLSTITRRVVIDARRKKGRSRELVSLSDANAPAGDMRRERQMSPDETLQHKELQEAVRNGIAGLPLDLRDAITLVVQEGLPYAEAAEALNCAAGTVAWRVWKARDVLRRRLQPYLSP